MVFVAFRAAAEAHRDGFWEQADAIGWKDTPLLTGSCKRIGGSAKESGGITVFCELTSPENLLQHCQ